MGSLTNLAEIEGLIKDGYYLNPKQAAAYLGVTVKTLADYRSFGRKPEYIKFHNKVRYSPEVILEYKTKQSDFKNRFKHHYLRLTTPQHDIPIMNNESNKCNIIVWPKLIKSR